MRRFSLKVSEQLHAAVKTIGSQQQVVIDAVHAFFEKNMSADALPTPSAGGSSARQLNYKMEDELIMPLRNHANAPTSREVQKLIRRIVAWYVDQAGKKHVGTYLQGLDDDLTVILKNRIRDEWTHDSTALEGNTLTLGETSFILNEGLTIAGKSLREHDEISGHARAIEIIYNMYEIPRLTETHLFELHRAVICNPPFDVQNPVGNWKRVDNGSYWGREYILYPSPERTPALMKSWLARYNSLPLPTTHLDAARQYTDLHITFASIHPFYDGNSRMARLIANLPVIKAGYPPITIDSERRFDYLELMRKYMLKDDSSDSLECTGDLEKFIDFAYSEWKKTLSIVDEIHAIQRSRKQ